MGCRVPGREAAWVTPWGGVRGRQESPRCSGGRQAAAPGLCPLLAVLLAAGGCPLGVAARVSAGWDPRLALQRGFLFFFPFWKKFNGTHTWQRGGGKQQGCVA